MQGELAQIISLTSYGNEFLSEGKIYKNYFPDNSTFQFCNTVDFRDLKKRWLSSKLEETIIAKNPLIWFENLKKEGCTKFRLYYKPSTDITFGPEYNLAGLSGGAGTWLIEAIYGDYSDYWQKHWQVSNQNAADRKIWTVNYARTLKKSNTANQQLDIASITTEFKTILTDLIEFCYRQDLQDWRETFEKGLSILSSPTPNKEYYHQDLIVNRNYSLVAQQLLFSVGQSWVFGGMGWWNDMGFESKEIQESYLQLSQKLYDLLLKGIIATINSY